MYVLARFKSCEGWNQLYSCYVTLVQLCNTCRHEYLQLLKSVLSTACDHYFWYHSDFGAATTVLTSNLCETCKFQRDLRCGSEWCNRFGPNRVDVQYSYTFLATCEEEVGLFSVELILGECYIGHMSSRLRLQSSGWEGELRCRRSRNSRFKSTLGLSER